MSQDNFDPAYEAIIFLSKLNAGDCFHWGSRKCTVVSATKSKEHGINDKIMLDIEGDKKRRITRQYGCYWGAETVRRGYHKYDWLNGLLRDIEGYIIVDLLNRNNPFHEVSVFSKHFLKPCA